MNLESNFTVSAILARCLVEPQFHRTLSSDPQGVLRGYGLTGDLRSSFGRFEFEKLELFGGLITQTQHNFLWESFPYSRALMKRYGIELFIFSSYRRTVSRRAGLSNQERTREFTDFLRHFLMTVKDKHSHPGLFEILKHERLQWELQQITETHSPKAKTIAREIPSRSLDVDRLIPDFPAYVRFEEYRYDPMEIVSAMESRDFDLSRLKPRLRGFLYRLDHSTSKLSVFQTTSAACRLFQKVDGRRSVGSILRASTSKRPKRELRRYFESACASDLIELRSS